MDSAWAMQEAQGDQSELAARLVDELPRLRAFVRRLLGDGAARGEVDDVLQEVAARAWKYRAGFDEARELGPWLRGLAVRAVLDARARRGRSRTGGDVEELAVELTEPLDSREHVARLLEPLAPVERDVLMRFHGRGESVGEIAAALALPENTVKSHLHRARKKLAVRARPEDAT